MNRSYLTPRSTAAVAWIIALLAFSTHAADRPDATPEQAWHLLKDGNERFVTGRLANKNVGPARRKELAAAQQPMAIVLACADSRVAPEIIFDQGLGELFVVRVAGNVSEPFALGSIDYAVQHLHVPLIVVLGHEKCGAVAAALEKERPAGNLGKLIDEIDVGQPLSTNRDEQLAGAVENNARRQAELLTERSDVIREQVRQKKLQIVSGVYSLASGKVQWMDAK
jgi:carbonic anhydrase